MSSSKQTDVASKINSGDFRAGNEQSGKILPLSQAAKVLNTPLKPASEPVLSRSDLQRSGNTDMGRRPLGLGNQENRNQTLVNAVTSLNAYIQKEQRDLEFTVSGDAGTFQIQVKVVNRQSGELIRLIPNNEVVDLARNLNDQEPLRLFSAQV